METDNRRLAWKKFWKKRYGTRKVLFLMILTVVITGLTVGGILSGNYISKLKQEVTPDEQRLNPLKNDRLLNAAQAGDKLSVVQIAEKVGPSIVGIRTTVQAPVDQLFGGGGKNRAEGSGIIITEQGYIMTNYHVVQAADPRNNPKGKVLLEVFLPDKRKATATFVGGDSLNDLAVIKVNLRNLPVAELGDSDQLKVGALAVAIGNPLGLEFAGSVTSGVISALNRTIMLQDRELELIQTDAAINPGNSGGALVDENGKVVGVNTIKISVSGVEGLGFAIPINNARPIVEELMKHGYVRGRPYIGVSGQEIPKEIARRYNLPEGIYIADVTPNTGAAKAGIKKNDILISMAGQRIMTMRQLNAVKMRYKAGDKVKVVVVRNNRKVGLNLTFSEAR
ncbi:MAG TPA: trypsin-like peptidase domain-containing protein [Bacillota bacterium]|jgi:serine protease Do|nr:trypsin-like peptidase domain-containing protein [Bacillota bacterium]HOL09030.1 trypsin-like peptidase domain-containing protein [Bacillota bacterium]HPO96705.1 trypsin-like peptidase domain-containing protein [Bacillota bacterium]